MGENTCQRLRTLQHDQEKVTFLLPLPQLSPGPPECMTWSLSPPWVLLRLHLRNESGPGAHSNPGTCGGEASPLPPLLPHPPEGQHEPWLLPESLRLCSAHQHYGSCPTSSSGSAGPELFKSSEAESSAHHFSASAREGRTEGGSCSAMMRGGGKYTRSEETASWPLADK